MINTLKISSKQVQLCKDIIAHFTAKGKGTEKDPLTEEMQERYKRGLFRRVELREAHLALTGHVACPYFITKNKMAKASLKEGASLYNVQRFIDHAAKHPPVEEPAADAAEKPKAKAKKNAAPKKEAAKSKKGGKKAPAETPAETATEPPAEAEVAPAETVES